MRSVLGLGVVSVTLRDSVDRLRREIFEIDDDDLTEFYHLIEWGRRGGER